MADLLILDEMRHDAKLRSTKINAADIPDALWSRDIHRTAEFGLAHYFCPSNRFVSYSKYIYYSNPLPAKTANSTTLASVPDHYGTQLPFNSNVIVHGTLGACRTPIRPCTILSPSRGQREHHGRLHRDTSQELTA